jgi:hypothetical protein
LQSESASAIAAHCSAVTLGWFLPPGIKDLNVPLLELTELPPDVLREPVHKAKASHCREIVTLIQQQQ